MKKAIVILLHFLLFLSFSVNAEFFLWSSPEELESIAMSGPAWDKVLEAADQADGDDAFISDQEYHNNVQILAAAIVYARTGSQLYKDKVVTAIEKLVSDGYTPAEPNTGRNDYNRTLAWGREAGAYVLAADLVDYRTPEFESWCLDLAENWEDQGNDWTLLYTFKHRPNNWGTHAFSTLVVLYAYLGETEKLNEIYFDRLGGLTGIGQPAELSYGDLCWQYDEDNPVLINPRGATKNGANIDGLAPDDMRRGNCTISDDPKTTNYAWEFLQGELVGTRVLNRLGYPIYQAADYAYQRAVAALQERLSSVNSYWFAQGDDEPQIPFWDEAFGTNYSASYDPESSELYKSGKSFGWGYVTLGDKSKDLSVTTDGVGNGFVTLFPASGIYPTGTQVTITATANPGSSFASWGGAINSTDNPVTLSIDSAIQIVATFNSSAGGGGTGSSGELAVSSVTASADDGNAPSNTLDKSLGTRWSANGEGQWIHYDLGSEQTVGSVYIAWYKGDSRISTFDIDYSLDGVTWQSMFSGQSGGNTRELEEFDLNDTTTRFVRITAYGNSSNSWNSITEVEIHGSPATLQQFSISTTINGTGSGSVIIDPPGITFEEGTELTITAIADANSTFSSWSGDLAGVNNPTTLIVDSAKQITATFNSTSGGGGTGNSGELAIASVIASADDGNGPSNTLDKSLGTRWSANGDGQWIRYDLGSAQIVESVYIAWYKGDSRLSTFDIDYSLDGVTWQSMFSGQSGGNTRELEEFDLNDTTTRFVRITAYGNSSNSWNSITEIEIHGSSAILQQFSISTTINGTGSGSVIIDPPGITFEEGTELTITAIADANSTFSSWSGDLAGVNNPTTLIVDSAKQITATFNSTSGGGGTGNSGELAIASVIASADDGNGPSNTLDKSLGTRWSANGDGQWIRYDLGNEQTVDLIYVAWYKGDSRIYLFDIDYSLDGVTWQSMFSGQSVGNTRELEAFDLNDMTARFVRITAYGNSSNSWNSMTEVEIHGSSTATE